MEFFVMKFFIGALYLDLHIYIRALAHAHQRGG